MALYESIPESVEAWKVTKEEADQLAEMVGGRVVEEKPTDGGNSVVGINVPSLSGNFRVSQGDYLVQNGRNQWRRESARYFETHYREV